MTRKVAVDLAVMIEEQICNEIDFVLFNDFRSVIL